MNDVRQELDQVWKAIEELRQWRLRTLMALLFLMFSLLGGATVMGIGYGSLSRDIEENAVGRAAAAQGRVVMSRVQHIEESLEWIGQSLEYMCAREPDCRLPRRPLVRRREGN